MPTRGKQRMLQGTFGSLTYSSGLIEPGNPEVLPLSPQPSSVQFNELVGNYMAAPRHNDDLYVCDVTPGTTNPNLEQNQRFMTHQYVESP